MDYDTFILKYGNRKVKFRSYYKYMFSFCDNNGLVVYSGGCADDIYKISVEADKEYFVSEIEPESAYLNEKSIGNWGF